MAMSDAKEAASVPTESGATHIHHKKVLFSEHGYTTIIDISRLIA
jgi:hypothetical protein